MKVAVVVPVWIQDSRELIKQTCKSAACLRSRHDLRLFVACTRLHIVSPAELQAMIQVACGDHCDVQVLHEPCVERSVAGAWNWGCRSAIEQGADLLMVTANDVEVEPGCIDALVEYGEKIPWSSIWSGLDRRHQAPPNPYDVLECCDFACVMLRPSTLSRFGWFDEGFRPCYFEDNDYYARVVLGGGQTRTASGARFVHHGSLTSRLEPEASHHVRHWFEINRRRYYDKWKIDRVMNTPLDVLAHCCPNPWGNPDLPISCCDPKGMPSIQEKEFGCV